MTVYIKLIIVWTLSVLMVEWGKRLIMRDFCIWMNKQQKKLKGNQLHSLPDWFYF